MKKTLLVIALLTHFNVAASNIKTAHQALEDGNIKLAKTTFEKFTKEEKTSIAARIVQGRILLSDKDGEPAYDHFETLIEEQSDNIDANYYFALSSMVMAQQASIFSKLGYAEDFVEAIEKTLALNPKHADALQTAIGFYAFAPSMAGGDSDKALAYANRLKGFEPIKGISQLAMVYRQTDKTELAMSTLAEGINSYPKNSELYFLRAIALMDDEKWQSASDDLAMAVTHAKDDKEKSKALYQQGKVSVKSQKNIDLGIESLVEAIELSDDSYLQWGNYRLAQLYIINKDADNAKLALSAIDVSEDDELKSKVKKLRKKLKKLIG